MGWKHFVKENFQDFFLNGDKNSYLMWFLVGLRDEIQVPRVLRSLVFYNSFSGFCCNGYALCLLLQSAVYLAEKSYDTDPRERKSFGFLSYHPNSKITNEGHTSTSFQIHCL